MYVLRNFRFCIYLYLQAKIVIFPNKKYHHEKEHDLSYILATLDFCVGQILTEMWSPKVIGKD